MFYIAYKADGTTACKKQISLFRLTEVGKTKSGATLYCTPSTENDGAPYRWFYTVEGICGLLEKANISPYAEPEQVRAALDGMSKSQANASVPGRGNTARTNQARHSKQNLDEQRGRSFLRSLRRFYNGKRRTP